MKRQTVEERWGFTLIELMVVVAILGVLVTIALPQFAKYRRSAQNAAAKAALAQVATAQEDYYLLHNGYANALVNLANWYVPEPTMAVNVLAGDKDSWSATANHISSTDVFTYTSSGGGLL
ncbi:MAG: prepilin-type N-terminal cleavage/methylation domain-containing protein [Pseudomonadota bacterium]